MSQVYGLTGGIASGKSMVSQYLLTKGYPVIDADKVAREVVASGSEGLALVVQTFGENILLSNGQLDRKKLNQQVFNSSDARKKLNAILHPLIFNQMKTKIELLAQKSLIFLDVPLLFEVPQFLNLCDKTLVIWVDKHTQQQRLMVRDHLSAEEADKRIAAQLDLDIKRERADYWIDNSKSSEYTLETVNQWLEQIS